ncbi:hypothetical protein [Candidatus Accumulibacter sp. ACC007]|uniref:hypothetical protein n=1 Tax=Candidatus Accumulibacter sp. ACC007 TaxID=2823333 RepID=UPI0025BC9711|nr:hypothetical protein [Candidatus Accumulibacter sp. ACC007]
MVSQSALERVAATGQDGAASAAPRIKLAAKDLTISYGKAVALKDVNLEIREHEIFGIIGPANAGKTSFLKAVNRMDVFNTGMHVPRNPLQRPRYPPPEKCLCAAQSASVSLSAAGRPCR